MNMNFKDSHGKIVNPIDHCNEMVNRYPGLKIYVGTDSQSKKKWTRYATVIAFRYNLRGVHYIYHHERVKRITDSWTRLWREVELSVKVAQMLSDNDIHVDRIDLDFNDQKETVSTKLVGAGKGWCQALGYNVNVKPDELLATKAADHLVR